MDNRLAIVIPAYKIDFFKDVLESLNNQTCKDFNLYIGVDASEADFESIIAQYASSLNIVCKRFESNLGGKDLVAQWQRCLDMTQGEEWIMLFSDDDILGNRCIELFYQEIRKNGAHHDLYHFDVDVIDGHNRIVRHTTEYPPTYSSVDFLKDKCMARIESFVVEYIFRRATFEQLGGFQRFDMAWGTDIATWAKLGKRKGIKTIGGDKVRWRKSSVNITPDTGRQKICRKLAADVKFIEWCRDNFSGITLGDTYYYMFRLLFHYSPYIKKNDLTQTVKPFYCTSAYGRVIFSMLRLCYPALAAVNRARHQSS